LFRGINKALLRIKIGINVISRISSVYFNKEFIKELKELLAHFSKKDYKQEYIYNYSKEYFKDKLISNFNIVNFALSN
jgi:hypothetical protein